MMNLLARAAVPTLAVFSIALAAPAQAAPNPVLDALENVPVSTLTFGLDNLRGDLKNSFRHDDPAPYAVFAAPLTGSVSDIATLIYSQDKGTITLNLVKIEKLPEGATPDDACTQAMAALRAFASLDPVSGKPYEGMETSALPGYFALEGTPASVDAAKSLDLDQLFRLRFNGFTPTQRFTCTANLLGTGYELEVK